MLIACVINIGLDFLFVAVIPMGVGGTALATVLSQALSMITAIIYLKKKDFIFDFRLGSFRPHKDIIRKLAKVGIPISLQEIAAALGKKDHSTIIHGIKRIEHDLETNTTLQNNIDVLTKKINPQ